MNPRRTTRRGYACGSSLGDAGGEEQQRSARAAAAARRSAIAERPSATDRNSGTTKKIPAWTRNMKKNEMTPSRSWMFRSIVGSISAAWPRAIRRFSHITNRRQHHAAAEHEPDHRREPEPLGSIRLGLHEAPRPRLQDADHDQAEAGRGQRRADQVEPGALLGRRVVHAPRQSEDHEHDQHLADEHPPPRGIGGEHAADQRPRAPPPSRRRPRPARRRAGARACRSSTRRAPRSPA